MIRNYFKTAFRNLLRHKTNSIINIAGLAVGFAAFLMIFLVIQFEQSFDNFHANRNNIYRVVRIGKNPVNREYRTGVPFPVTPTLRIDLPQLKNAAAIFDMNNVILALSLIGLFLLIIACVNFINLTTAQAINRSREVGVRKVLGGSRAQLIFQFLGETGITTFLALAGALLIVFICLPFVNNLLDIHLTISFLYNTKFILFILGALLLVSFLSGFYPALVLSGFKPVNVLKNALNTNNIKGVSFRRALVVFQFVIAQALIIGTLVVASQMNYFSNADLGFDKQAIINAGFPNDSLSETKTGFLLNKLHKTPGIQNVSFSLFAPSDGNSWNTDLRTTSNLKGPNPDMVISMKPADTSYFSLYNLPLVAGRVYFPSDTIREFVVNETVIKNLGITNAQSAIGKLVNVNGQTCPIVGVVKDFHAYSLRDKIGAVVFTTMKKSIWFSQY